VVTQVLLSGAEITEYPKIAVPGDAGAIHVTVAAVFPGTAVGALGASGAPMGVTDIAGLDATEVAPAFVAVTVTV